MRTRPVAVDIDGDGIDDLGFWVPDNGVPSTAKPGDWYFLLSGGLSLAEHSTYTVVHYQFGSSVGLPLTGAFAATTTTGVYPPVVAPQIKTATRLAASVAAPLAASAVQPIAPAPTPAAMTVTQTTGSTTNLPAATTVTAPLLQVATPTVLKPAAPAAPAETQTSVAAAASLTTSSSVKSTLGSTIALVHIL